MKSTAKSGEPRSLHIDFMVHNFVYYLVHYRISVNLANKDNLSLTPKLTEILPNAPPKEFAYFS